jgi:hypothetical protein
MPVKSPPFKRLMSGYELDVETGCWLWMKTKYRNGYGWLKVFGKNFLAHRYSYELHKGPIQEGMEVMHTCDNPACINPNHLEMGTHTQNMRGAAERNRLRKGDRHPMYRKKNPKPKQANIVQVLGRVYESQNAAERALGLGSGTVRYWIINNPHKAKILKKGNKSE